MKRKRIALLATLAVLVTGTVGVSGARAIRHRPVGPTMRSTTSDATDVLWGEIQAMLADGVMPNDPKVVMLEEDLTSLQAGEVLPEVAEPGVDLGGVLGMPHRGGTRAAALDLTTAVAWDNGVVECEPLPPDILSVAEIDDARCVSAPQPDGTSRYVAIVPDGTVRVVRFASDGAVSRQPDLHLDLLGIPLPGIELVVELLGDVVLTVSGEPVATIDVG